MVEQNEDFEIILMCAVRYSLGRRSYMPMLVINYITPLLPRLSVNTLQVMQSDIALARGWGDEVIDKPCWMKFLADIRTALAEKRRADNG